VDPHGFVSGRRKKEEEGVTVHFYQLRIEVVGAVIRSVGI
jgi:hypothetical protein